MKLRSIALGSVASAALLAGSAFAADLPVRGPAPTPVLVAPIFSWTGFYAGVNAGYGGNKFEYPYSGVVGNDAYTIPPVSTTEGPIGPGTPVPAREIAYGGKPSITSSGALFGAQIGYNWQFASRWVIGLEADYQWSNIEGRVSLNGDITGQQETAGANLSVGSEVTGFGTVRARLGYGWDRALLYVTGGWAYGSVKSSGSLSYAGMGDAGAYGLSKKNNPSSGWTIGAGLEYALTNNLSFKTEYLFVDLGSESLYSASYENLGQYGAGYATARLDVDTKFHVVRAGLNYRFGWGSASAPVVARY